ncbi:MAG: hypothetical protein N4A35_09315 [Flavobacteriales bacterium]|jgi:uncharacterized protein (TIGR00661 family)|nr:hypothetical protein [Flavobacteriales bacterium]
MSKSKIKIFISPLDWGLGHTTRCIPLIKALQNLGGLIWLGVNKEQKQLLMNEVQQVEYIDFKGYNISYPTSGKMALKMGVQIPKIIRNIHSENRQLKKLINKYQFDLIISDNRFGLYASKVPSIYITHQINIQAPLGIDRLLYQLHQQYISKYDQCWIPDSSNRQFSLAGKLSQVNSKHKKYQYIGALSRFSAPIVSLKSEYKYLAIISGPEPQRSLFEQEVISYFNKIDEKCAIIGGTPLKKAQIKLHNIDYFPHLPSTLFLELVSLSEKIICRPGYSSIMDLSILQKPVFFVPTNGQTEQEYLAKYYFQNYNIGYCSQEQLQELIHDSQFKHLPYQVDSNLKEQLKSSLNSLGFSF